MKKLISICFLLFFVYTGNAQENNKSKWSELNQDQLNLALTKSKKTIKTGKIITFSGLGVYCIGYIMAMGPNQSPDPSYDNNSDAGSVIAVIGGIISYAGIIVWAVGATKKYNINLELAKFNPPGSASINGIGLKIRF
jgi:hypothetical protein